MFTVFLYLSSFFCDLYIFYMSIPEYFFVFLWSYSVKSYFTSNSNLVRYSHNLFDIQEITPFPFFWNYVMLLLLFLKSVFPFEEVVVYHFIYLNVVRHQITYLSLALELNDPMNECLDVVLNNFLLTNIHQIHQTFTSYFS